MLKSWSACENFFAHTVVKSWKVVLVTNKQPWLQMPYSGHLQPELFVSNVQLINFHAYA